jgi:hypothetical protein
MFLIFLNCRKLIIQNRSFTGPNVVPVIFLHRQNNVRNIGPLPGQFIKYTGNGPILDRLYRTGPLPDQMWANYFSLSQKKKKRIKYWSFTGPIHKIHIILFLLSRPMSELNEFTRYWSRLDTGPVQKRNVYQYQSSIGPVPGRIGTFGAIFWTYADYRHTIHLKSLFLLEDLLRFDLRNLGGWIVRIDHVFELQVTGLLFTISF